jgi:hypothetical protein
VALNECLTGARSFDQAMIDYQRDRDAKVLPMYEFTRQLASLDPTARDAADFGDAKVISKFGVPDDLSTVLSEKGIIFKVPMAVGNKRRYRADSKILGHDPQGWPPSI